MLLLLAAAQIVVAWMIGRMVGRRGAAWVGLLVALGTLVPVLTNLPAPAKPSTIPLPWFFQPDPWDRAMLKDLIAWLILSLPVLAAFRVGQFRREGRLRLMAISLFWGLLVVEGIVTYGALQSSEPVVCLCGMLAMGVTLVGGAITIFALPPDRGAQKA